MLVLISFAVVWAAVLVSYGMSRYREGRPGSSVVSFRRQLSTLERATPGHSLRLSTTGPVPVVRSVPPAARKDQRKRRRDVLFTLSAATATTALLALVVGGIAVVAFVLSALTLGGYVWALVQMRRRTAERLAKVRVLRPRVAPPASMEVRTSASG